MATFGINIVKKGLDDAPVTNTYYGDVSDVSEALDLADIFVVGERIIFGTTVRFIKTHVWLVGSTAPVFGNKPLTGFGTFNANTPFRKEITLECSFGVSSSYPSTKSYRVQLNTDTLSGTQWSSVYQPAIDDFNDFMQENFFRLTNRDGSAFSSFGISEDYGIKQYKKRWYNRTAAE